MLLRDSAKAIVYPIKDGRIVPCEGRVIYKPTCLEQLIATAWQIAHAVGWMMVGYAVCRFW